MRGIIINIIIAIYLAFYFFEAHGKYSNRYVPTVRNFQFNHDRFEKGLNCSVEAILSTKTMITDKLTFVQTMMAGAASRTIAQTVMHPANTYKTMLQLKGNGHIVNLTPERLLRGADAQFFMSLPHGAFYFFVIDAVKKRVTRYLPQQIEFIGDFTCSSISTIVCSVISTPQMVLTDRLMAGVYPSLAVAVKEIHRENGLSGFYRGWWPALAQKIPSYGLTWMFFQQMKRLYQDMTDTPPNAEWNFGLGAAAAAAAVCVMIPVDVIKTRLVTQAANCPGGYKGMQDCFARVLREEGVGAFYRSLPPRLVAVVPMIAIQFGVYEVLQKYFERANFEERTARLRQAAAKRVKSRAKQLRAKVASVREKKKTFNKCSNRNYSSSTGRGIDSSSSSSKNRNNSDNTNSNRYYDNSDHHLEDDYHESHADGTMPFADTTVVAYRGGDNHHHGYFGSRNSDGTELEYKYDDIDDGYDHCESSSSCSGSGSSFSRRQHQYKALLKRVNGQIESFYQNVDQISTQTLHNLKVESLSSYLHLSKQQSRLAIISPVIGSSDSNSKDNVNDRAMMSYEEGQQQICKM